MQTMPLEQAEGRLAELIEELSPGEEIVFTHDGKPVAILKAPPSISRDPPRLGTLKGTIQYIAPDFDDIPEGFEEYLP